MAATGRYLFTPYERSVDLTINKLRFWVIVLLLFRMAAGQADSRRTVAKWAELSVGSIWGS